jgi:hypothetical protein
LGYLTTPFLLLFPKTLRMYEEDGEKLYTLKCFVIYSIPVIRVIDSGWVRWARHVAHTETKKYAEFRRGNAMGGKHLGYLSSSGRILLKCISVECDCVE